jgi:hypothetical protein
MAKNSEDFSDVSAAALLPTVNLDDFQPGAL